jgi:hypothetical protein
MKSPFMSKTAVLE